MRGFISDFVSNKNFVGGFVSSFVSSFVSVFVSGWAFLTLPISLIFVYTSTTFNTFLSECWTGDQSSYRGSTDVNIGGGTCQKWTSQSPNQHTRTPKKYVVLKAKILGS